MPKCTDDSLTEYQKDSRVACQYGEKCYQKNPAHHAKYKHPPKISKVFVIYCSKLLDHHYSLII